ncbi:hypothetical protein HK097_008228 [Rhizophlyctis rosea]|uniref:DUF5898 domain-containing protein n=1 Tax=Rhizophlyctis rosea TaxID=64517 RepID=A0AAD5SID9_9FUNG|nr:hypothetical protein HK097_008228 [Rhizophlyctis rosea]
MSYVKYFLMDVLLGLGLASSIRVEEDYTIFSEFQPDIYVIWSDACPIGVVEVKKPTEGILDAPVVWGQIFDYMAALRKFQGLQNVFGIITTYEKWWLCWLPESDGAASDETPIFTPAAHRQSPFRPKLPPAPTWKFRCNNSADNFKSKPKMGQQKFENRVFSETAELSWDNPMLGRTLASLICKMAASPITFPSPEQLLSRRFTLCFTEHMIQWRTRDTSDVRFDVFPDPSHKNFFLLADLHGGADGHVWLATTNGGIGCVIKMSRRHFAAVNIERESARWNQLWKTSTYTLSLVGRTVVVLPYVRSVKPHSEDVPIPETVKNATIEAITVMADAGMQHIDLKWSHVGSYVRGRDKKENIVLFDLARVKEGVEPDVARKAMLKALALD